MGDALKLAQDMGRMKHVCPKCDVVFCLNCGNEEGYRQKTMGEN
jgi:hypothetical protein